MSNKIYKDSIEKANEIPFTQKQSMKEYILQIEESAISVWAAESAQSGWTAQKVPAAVPATWLQLPGLDNSLLSQYWDSKGFLVALSWLKPDPRKLSFPQLRVVLKQWSPLSHQEGKILPSFQRNMH